ncbi:MAG: glycosyltransferase family 2 protein [Armatimonadetes bacterium]|nr:glycosyltransferase family 2 protein [Armatimonadota bacterium]
MIYILLPVHNRREITRYFIDCLTKQTYTNYHLVLIDDGSTDGTAEMVKHYVHELTIIRGNGNWWWGGSLQQGYKWLKLQKLNNDDIVLIINDDTTFKDDLLEIGQTILNQHLHTLLLAQAYSMQDNRLIDAGVHVDWKQLRFSQAKSTEEINCLSTRGLFIRAEDFLALGGFYSKMLPHYASDYEFTIRAHHKGMRLLSVPSLQLWTNEKTTGQRQFNQKLLISHIREIFSKGSVRNPLYITSFILLSCPWRWKAINIFKVWHGVIAGGVTRFLKHLRK